MTTAVFLLFFAAIFAHFAGYLLVLFGIKKLKPRDYPDVSDRNDKRVDIVVTVFNEEKMIDEKLQNLCELSYPKELVRILVCDGGSEDKTRERVETFLEKTKDRHIELLNSPRKGKIQQLNFALQHVDRNAIALVTDADALINSPNAIERAVALLESSEDIGLVGGWTMPPASKWVPAAEHGFWDKQNRMRFMETICYSSSIVVAPFYAFQRKLVSFFPEDCVADDVYISYVAHLKNVRVLYDPEIDVTETRHPHGLVELTQHKFRKTNAYTKELLRVLHALPQMSKRVKFLFAFKIFQFFYLPWVFIGFTGLTVWLTNAGHWALLTWSFAVLVAGTGAASLAMTPPPHRSRGGLQLVSLVSSVQIMVIMQLVLMTNFFTFPFWRQKSTYARLSMDLPKENASVATLQNTGDRNLRVSRESHQPDPHEERSQSL